ncbi:ATP-binding protein [Amycolatopsis sp. NPDC004378]
MGAHDLPDGMVLGAYEAMTYVVEHAYSDEPTGPLAAHAELNRGRLGITVIDCGTWKPPNPANTLRGRRHLLIDAGKPPQRHDGTTVTMSSNLLDANCC